MLAHRRSADMAAIDRAARAVGYTNPHLRRVCREFVGTAPAEYMRLRWFNLRVPSYRDAMSRSSGRLVSAFR
jgi:AraC-like DNA-binding protein